MQYLFVHIGENDIGTGGELLDKGKGIVYSLFIQVIGHSFPNNGSGNGEVKLFACSQLLQAFFIKIYLPVMDMVWQVAQFFFENAGFSTGGVGMIYFNNRNG